MEKITLAQWGQLLPYGVDTTYTLSDVINLSASQSDECRHKKLDIHSIGFCFNNCSPILYPIDCLTKEITVKGYNNGEPFVPIVELNKKQEWLGLTKFKYIEGFEDIKPALVFDSKLEGYNVVASLDVVQTLLSWHINVIGVPDGLFVDKSKI